MRDIETAKAQPFDRASFEARLCAGAVPPQAAAAWAELVEELLAHTLATKADIAAARHEIDILRRSVRKSSYFAHLEYQQVILFLAVALFGLVLSVTVIFKFF